MCVCEYRNGNVFVIYQFQTGEDEQQYIPLIIILLKNSKFQRTLLYKPMPTERSVTTSNSNI